MTSPNGNGSFLGRDAILAFADRPSEPLQVPEWGNQWVRVGTWTLSTQWRIARASQEETQRGRLLAVVVALSVVDEAGARLFTDDDVPRLAEGKSYRALNRIAQAAMRWNGLDAPTVEALGKVSESDPSDASPSVSPASSG